MQNWKIKTSLFLNYFVFAILLNSVGTVILQVQQNFGVTESSASVLEAFKDLSIAIVSFLVSSYIVRIGYKNAMLFALGFISIICFIMPFTASFFTTKLLFAAVGSSFALIKMSVYSTIGLVTKNHESVKLFTEKMTNRLKAIQQYCWSEEKGFYFDYHFKQQKNTDRITMAGCFPLFLGIADDRQAQAVAVVIKEQLLAAGGVLTTTLQTDQQWDAPNGWAPLQWVAFKGLKNYQQHELADEIKKRWTRLNETTYNDTGKMMEKYNVKNIHTKAGGGEYPNQDGFGWTNGVYLAMKNETEK